MIVKQASIRHFFSSQFRFLVVTSLIRVYISTSDTLIGSFLSIIPVLNIKLLKWRGSDNPVVVTVMPSLPCKLSNH